MSTGKRDSSARFAGFAMTGGSNLGGEKGAKKTCCSRNTPLQVKILAKLLSIGKVEREAEILVHEAQRKTRHVFAFEQVRRLDVEDTGAGHAGLHDFNELFTLDASAGDEGKSLG